MTERLRGEKVITPARALVPLRLFLGVTFVYAGVQKLSDPGFLNPDAPTYIGTQLSGFADGTPGGPLLEPALSHPELTGVAVALVEIVIGVLVMLGVLTRLAAAGGLALNLLLFLTATWHTSPYFLGSDIVFVFAWLPFVLLDAEGQPTIRDLLNRRSVGLGRAVLHGREIAIPQLRRGRPMNRRAMLTQALGVAGLLATGAATASTLARGRYEAPARRARGSRRSGEAGADLGPADALAPGDAKPYTDPATGEPGIVIRAADGKLFAVGAVCTHAGCDLRYGKNVLRCPCHGSTFDIRTGAPEHGPARDPLPTAAVAERGGRILVRDLA